MALLNGLLHALFGRILNTVEADEDHVVKQRRSRLLDCEGTPVFVRWVLHLLLSDGKDPAGFSHELFARSIDFGHQIWGHWLDARILSATHVGVLAHLRYALRGALERRQLVDLVL